MAVTANFKKTSTGNENGERHGIQVIARAAAILRTLEAHPDGLSLGEIAKRVDLPRSTVQRIVDALAHENLVVAPSTNSGVRLGPALITLGAAAKFEIADLARETLEIIAHETGETVDLAVFDQNKIVFIDQVPGMHRLQAVSAVGLAFSLHCSANGKAVLAALPDEKLDRLRKKLVLEPFTKNTIRTWEELEKEIQAVQETGIAYDREEQSMGICAVSAALTGPSGEIAAISIPVPTQRFISKDAALADILLIHRDRLQRRLQR